MNHYTILNIPKTASLDEVKSAYRTLAKQHHPDKGGDKEMFQRVQEAYEVLSDEEKRAQYDQPQQSRVHPHANPFASFFQQFHSHTFRHERAPSRQKVQMEDVILHLTIPLRDAFARIVKKCKHVTRAICSTCTQTCVLCHGIGHKVQVIHPLQKIKLTCTLCGGNGFTYTARASCPNVCADGFYRKDHIFQVTITPDKIVNFTERFVGKGSEPTNKHDTVGDCVVRVSINCPHLVTIRGTKLIFTPKLSMKEVICGTTVCIPNDIPIPLSTSREVHIPPLVAFRKTAEDSRNDLLVKGCGMTLLDNASKASEAYARDDLLVEPIIDMSTLEEAINDVDPAVIALAFKTHQSNPDADAGRFKQI